MEVISNNNNEKDILYDEAEIKNLLWNLGRVVRNARLKMKLNINEVALASNLSLALVQKVESGQSNITFSNLCKLVYALNIYPDDIFPFGNPKPRDHSAQFNKLTRNLEDEEIAAVFNVIQSMADLVEHVEYSKGITKEELLVEKKKLSDLNKEIELAESKLKDVIKEKSNNKVEE